MTVADMPALAAFITTALSDDPETIAGDVTIWREQFRDIHFTTDNPT
jgi:glycine hydroxymethyltransferase